MKRKLVLFVGLALVVAISVGGVVVYKKKKGAEGLEVEVAPVARQTIVQTVTATGRIQPKTMVNISADVSAKITALPVVEGQWVEKGTLLVELDGERYRAEVEVAEASLRAASSNVDLARENRVKAEKDYERAKELHQQSLESQAQLDAAYATAQAERARHQSSLDQAESARASLKQMRDALAKTRMYAPISGTISKLNKEVGEIALGSQFQEDVILELSNLAGMEALVDVDENDIVSVALGDVSTIEVDALPDTTLKGQVSEIANSAKLTGEGTTEQKTEFEVKVAVSDASDKLRPGMTASAEIVTETKHDVLGVPVQSVAVRTPEQLKTGALKEAPGVSELELEAGKDGFVSIVWVVRDGRAEARMVETGIQSDSHIEIVSGLAEGDAVVVGNYRAISKDLEHGAVIKVKEESAPSPLVATR